MFDLKKDLDKYQGIPPYASEHYGVYQPLLGWQSQLTKAWIKSGNVVIDPRTRKILDGRTLPGPVGLDPDGQIATPLEIGRGKSPYKVFLTRDLGSELLRRIVPLVQQFVDSHGGKLPSGQDEWLSVADINVLMGQDDSLMNQVNLYHRQRLWDTMPSDEYRVAFLDIMQFESQVGMFWISFAEGQEDHDPDELKRLFFVKEAAPLENLLIMPDPLAEIDPQNDEGVLSPVGFVHLFRQYFFDLGTFLGEPVEHVWLAPGTTTELIEVTTRRTLVERSLEEMFERTTRSEQASALTDELSDATKEQNESSVKVGVTQSNTVNAYVYQGTVSASFGVDTTRSTAREVSHKQVREQSEKLSTELKQSVKSFFKTVTETTDTRSRRYVITNPSNDLRNYELRRKMRRVGVQLQDIGTRLCWQVFVDNAGDQLGVAELVHMTEMGDLTNLKEPEKIPAPTNIVRKVVVPLAYKPVLDYSNNRAQYEYQGPSGGVELGIIKGDEDDDDSQIVIEFRGFKFDPPQTGYTLTNDIRITGVQANKMAVVRQLQPHPEWSTFDLVMQRINFGGENVINLEMELVYAPTADEIKRVEDLNKAAKDKFDEEARRAIRKAYLENVRARITDASNIRQRMSWDLREEERTVVYRNLISRLMFTDKGKPDLPQSRGAAHVRSEMIRSLFDVDAMLYFVAPEWWMPRMQPSHLSLDVDAGGPAGGPTVALTESDIVRWSGLNAVRASNYKITETSSPAALGSSLGWLLQLDGDNMRNAFLNAPWVKAVIPIRPGRELAALNWLKSVEGEDSLSATYMGSAPEDAEFQGQTVGEVLQTVAERLSEKNRDFGSTLAADKVFESGFDPLSGGFDAGLPANQVYDQWISILPTDQVVAVEYQATTLFGE